MSFPWRILSGGYQIKNKLAVDFRLQSHQRSYRAIIRAINRSRQQNSDRDSRGREGAHRLAWQSKRRFSSVRSAIPLRDTSASKLWMRRRRRRQMLTKGTPKVPFSFWLQMHNTPDEIRVSHLSFGLLFERFVVDLCHLNWTRPFRVLLALSQSGRQTSSF